jgi:hypothetical protein
MKPAIHTSVKKLIAVCVVLIVSLSLGGVTVVGLDSFRGETVTGPDRTIVLPDFTLSEHASLVLFGAGLWLVAANQRRRRPVEE